MDPFLYTVRDDADNRTLNETLFHCANGYLGVRACCEEGGAPDSMRGMYINGFYDIIDMKQAEPLYGLIDKKQVLLNVCDVQGIELYVDGERFATDGGTVLESTRTLDLGGGRSTRRVVWRSPGGKTVQVESVRMASLSRPSLFAMTYTVTALDFSGTVALRSHHIGDVRNHCDPGDPRMAAESVQNLVVQSVAVHGDRSEIVARTLRSEQALCSAVRHNLSRGAMTLTADSNAVTAASGPVALRQGEHLRLEKFASLADSVRCGDDFTAAAVAALAAADWETLSAEQRAALDRFWAGCSIEIDGDDRLTQALIFNQYQLFQSASRDAFGNMAAKGLSGEGYEGHYFWDSEMFVQPFFLLADPAICRSLIEYRVRTLDAARANARLLGHRAGALYPWRTISGEECSGHYPSGTAAYHINGDIAYAIFRYFDVTGDEDFLLSRCAELLIEIARLWLDVGNWAGGRFHINCVTGPDEYTCLVNDNYYTNALAQDNLRRTAALCERFWTDARFAALRARLGFEKDEVAAFGAAADGMTLLYDDALGINPQDDSFLQKAPWDFSKEQAHPLLLHNHPLHLYRFQLCKQADTVMSYFLLEDIQSAGTMRRSFDYYEPITTHDSSLSRCIFSIVAARLGDIEKAYEYFGESALLDLADTHHNTEDGIHTANMGGSSMSILYGFAGLRIRADGLYFSPRLPASWRSYRFRFRYRGAALELVCGKSGGSIRLLSGNPVPVFLDGERQLLS